MNEERREYWRSIATELELAEHRIDRIAREHRERAEKAAHWLSENQRPLEEAALQGEWSDKFKGLVEEMLQARREAQATVERAPLVEAGAQRVSRRVQIQRGRVNQALQEDLEPDTQVLMRLQWVLSRPLVNMKVGA